MNQKLPVSQNQPTSVTAAVAPAISLWVDHTTDPDSPRRADLVRDKSKAVLDFFAFTGKNPLNVTPLDVKTWQAELEEEGLAHSTVYAKISRISSFYEWAIENERAEYNPVVLARPRAPKAYQNESAQSLADEEAIALLRFVRDKAATGSLSARRDYALLLFYFFSGRRRREIMQLRWGDIKLGPGQAITITGQVKGGDYITFEIRHPEAREALLTYLIVSDRLAGMQADTPLWTAHDRSGQSNGKPLTSHAFVKNLKKYARQAGLGDIHLHQTRHTFARWVGEESGSIVETQDALGHKNLQTTKIYLERISLKKDKFSNQIGERLGLR